MRLKLVSAPTERAVSLPELKLHVRNTASDEDADLQLKLDAAEAWMRDELGRPLITSMWELHLEAWPVPFVYLPPNTQSVESVKYTDSAGVVQTVDQSLYKLDCAYDPDTMADTDAGAGRLYLAYGKSWPSATLDVGEPIVIRLVAGWPADKLPVSIKQAILMVASHWYRNRDAVVLGNSAAVISSEIAMGVQRLTSVYEERRI